MQGVGEIAVAGEGYLTVMPLNQNGLGIAQLATAGGGVTGVANGEIAGQGIEVGFSEDLADEAHFGVDIDAGAIGGGDAGAFLAPVLECEQAEESQTAGLPSRHISRHDPTFLTGVVEGRLELERVQMCPHGVIVFSRRA